MERKITMKLSGVPTLACVASLSSRGSSRKLGQEQKKKMNDGGGGGERRNLFSPPPPPSTFFLLPLYLSRNNSIGNACYAGYAYSNLKVSITTKH